MNKHCSWCGKDMGQRTKHKPDICKRCKRETLAKLENLKGPLWRNTELVFKIPILK